MHACIFLSTRVRQPPRTPWGLRTKDACFPKRSTNGDRHPKNIIGNHPASARENPPSHIANSLPCPFPGDPIASQQLHCPDVA